MTWYVYIVQCNDGSLYTGATTNVELRVKAHNKGRGAKYTRSRLPVRLVYSLELPNKSLALRKEAAIKKLTRAQKMELVLWSGE